MKRQLIALTVVTLVFAFGCGIASAQPRHFGPPPGYYHGPPGRPHYNRNLDSISRIFGAVAIIADSQRPVQQVVVAPPPPVVVGRPPVVVVETTPTVIERPVVINRPANVVYAVPSGYVGQLRTQFSLQKMKIPNFEEFTAAVLVTDPPKGSPLDTVGLRKGDAITRVNEVKVSGIDDLEYAQGETTIRYIKSGTTTVKSTTFVAPIAP